jgi:NitT/TauT family transport system permease protein
MSQVIAVMILIIAIGYIVDGLVFQTIERRLRRKWGVEEAAA